MESLSTSGSSSMMGNLKWIIICVWCMGLTYIVTIRSVFPVEEIHANEVLSFKSTPNIRMGENDTEMFSNHQNNMTVLKEHADIIESDQIVHQQVETLNQVVEHEFQEEKNIPEETTVGHSKGIIIAMSDWYMDLGLSLIRELRCLGNFELIQLYYCLDDLSAPNRAKILEYEQHIEMIDVCAFYMGEHGSHIKGETWSREQEHIHYDPMQEDAEAHRRFHGNAKFARQFQGYWIKPLAVYHTRLTEVIVIDADAVLMKDPSFLRENSGYKRTGTIFFHDKDINCIGHFNSYDPIPPELEGYFTEDQIKISPDGMRTVQRLKLILASFKYADFGIDGGMQPSEQLLNSLAWKELTCHEMDSSMLLFDKSKMSKKVKDVMFYFMADLRHKIDFGHGDKESFWLTYEIAHEPYFFSPWGITVLDSKPNNDLILHPQTLCGSMAQFTPIEDPTSPQELLYINGKFLLQPFPFGVDYTEHKGNFYNINPTHITPRHYRTDGLSGDFDCLIGLGSEPIPNEEPIAPNLLRRRLHYNSIVLGYYEPLRICIHH